MISYDRASSVCHLAPTASTFPLISHKILLVRAVRDSFGTGFLLKYIWRLLIFAFLFVFLGFSFQRICNTIVSFLWLENFHLSTQWKAVLCVWFSLERCEGKEIKDGGGENLFFWREKIYSRVLLKLKGMEKRERNEKRRRELNNK